MISRFTAKVLANSLLAGISIAMLTALFVSFHHDEILKEFGKEWVDDYAQSMRQEVISAFSQARKTNQTSLLTTLLEQPQWDEVLLDDRAYGLKRALLLRLCVALEKQRDYRALKKWSLKWLSLTGRDLDARAFWYEAIRHSSEQQEEGLQELITNQHAFPNNNYLAQFLIKAYKEAGDDHLANELLHKTARSEAQIALNAWQVYWATSNQNSFSEAQSQYLEPKFKQHNQLLLVTRIPADVISLRVDPPGGSRIRVYEIEAQIDNQTVRFPTHTIKKVNQMRREENSLVAVGQSDPQVYLSIGKYLESADREKVTVSIRFYVDVVIGEDELPLVDFFDRE